jgi:hypothetical protein
MKSSRSGRMDLAVIRSALADVAMQATRHAAITWPQSLMFEFMGNCRGPFDGPLRELFNRLMY